MSLASTRTQVGPKENIPRKSSSQFTSPLPNEKRGISHDDAEENDDIIIVGQGTHPTWSWLARHRGLMCRVKLSVVAALILAWWISATVLPATRHRWVVQTTFAWSFIAIIAFRFIPNSVVTRPVEAVWVPLVERPFFSISRYARYGLGWFAVVGIVIGSAFGFKIENGTNYGDRAISVLGLVLFQLGFWATSKHRSRIQWHTVIVSLFTQQAIALFVLKTGAGFHIFMWIANLASDFSSQGLVGATFFFDQDTVQNKRWLFVNGLSVIIFFIAFVQLLYYFGTMQWIIKHFAWFFFKTLDISGAEAVVAAASPLVGPSEAACLVRPYIDVMTESEIHLVMTSGFSTIAGTLLSVYLNFGVPAQNLVTASVMSIPASIAISKIRIPEIEEPVTRGHVVVDRGEDNAKDAPVNALHAYAKGAVFGLVVVGQVICNVIAILSLVAAINGLLTWIGRGFGINQLTLQLIMRYVFYPITFFLGVPRSEIMRVSELLATKLVANEFVAYLQLQELMVSPDALSKRGFTIASYALCGFANMTSLAIEIGVVSALAPSQTRLIARIGPSAVVCGFLSTLQAAGIAGMLV